MEDIGLVFFYTLGKIAEQCGFGIVTKELVICSTLGGLIIGIFIIYFIEYDAKVRINFYKYYFSHLKYWHYYPRFYYIKNVQGYFYTQSLSVEWFKYCASINIIKQSDLTEDRISAHISNVKKYLKSKK